MKRLQTWAVDRLLANDADFRDFAPGDQVFCTGDAGGWMGLIVRGAVDIRRDGRPIATIESGSVFGEMALIDGLPRSADAVAKTACRVALVEERHFRKLVREDPDFALAMLKTLTYRLRENLQT